MERLGRMWRFRRETYLTTLKTYWETQWETYWTSLSVWTKQQQDPYVRPPLESPL